MDVFLILLVFVSDLFFLVVEIRGYLVKNREKPFSRRLNLISILIFMGILIITGLYLLRQFVNLSAEIVFILGVVGMGFTLGGVALLLLGRTTSQRR